MTTLTDRRVWSTNPDRWVADAVSGQDYDPFGMVRPNRSVSEDGYRFGFNGKEKDTEFSNESYDFGARIYDGRVARWLSVDPLAGRMPHMSPYVSMDNSPLAKIDPDGKLPILIPVARVMVPFLIGAGIDYASQVSVNLANTNWEKDGAFKNFYNATVGNVDFTDVGVSGISNVFMPGASQIRNLGKVGKTLTVVGTVGLEVGKASIDLTTNKIESGNIEVNSFEKTATVATVNLVGGTILGEVIPSKVVANAQKQSYSSYNKGDIAGSYEMRGQLNKLQSTGEKAGSYTSNSFGGYVNSKFPTPAVIHEERNVAQQDATSVKEPPKTFNKP